MAAWREIRSCWHLTFPPGQGGGKLWLTATASLRAEGRAVHWRDVHRAEILWLLWLWCQEKKKRKKKGAFCFLHVLHFLPAASWAEDDFAPWATKETKTCPEVAEQSTALDMHWACVKGLSSASLLQQPSTGGGKLIGGVGGSGEAFKASKRGPKRGWAGQYLPELC